MLTSLPVPEPVGTYLANVRGGSMQLPPAIAEYCRAAGWSLFRFVVRDKDHVTIHPVLPQEPGDFHASLDADGKLWVPEDLRQQIGLGEQSVMLRVEDAGINMYLRKVFETLKFRPPGPQG
jgi:hypothetical protein